MPSIPEQKAELRREIRAQLRAVSDSDREAWSRAICSALAKSELVQNAERILTFAALKTEPDLEQLWELPKRWVFPRVKGKTLELWEAPGPEAFEIGSYGIREPVPDRCQTVSPDQLELVLVPGIAFGRSDFSRLGQGGGFYDRFLENREIPSIGVCFDLQIRDSVPTEAHDCRVTELMSECGFA